MARLYISKMKSEAKSLMTHCTALEVQQAENQKRLETAEEQLSATKLLLQQVWLWLVVVVFVVGVVDCGCFCGGCGKCGCDRCGVVEGGEDGVF